VRAESGGFDAQPSERRVLEGLAVPASEKRVSLFEPHADIILKGSRDVLATDGISTKWSAEHLLRKIGQLTRSPSRASASARDA
jgi:hypothetical protein